MDLRHLPLQAEGFHPHSFAGYPYTSPIVHWNLAPRVHMRNTMACSGQYDRYRSQQGDFSMRRVIAIVPLFLSLGSLRLGAGTTD